MKNKAWYGWMACLAGCLASCQAAGTADKIDREALVTRNNPQITAADPLASLSVGNGEFAFTTDVTGLQTFPEWYRSGVPLGTQSQWGWHSFGNPKNYRPEETLADYDFGRGRKEPYASQFRDPGRAKEASDWYRVNPHRLHLGIVGLEWDAGSPEQLTDIRQTLDMYAGRITSRFAHAGTSYSVETVCHPELDLISSCVRSEGDEKPSVKFHFPYPTGQHADDACDWTKDDWHATEVVEQDAGGALLKRTIDATVYYERIRWYSPARLREKAKNYFVLDAEEKELAFSCLFAESVPASPLPDFETTRQAAEARWHAYWQHGGVVDFSACKDPRAKELERRVVLSQYLTAIQCAGTVPPQETGLTYNSWFGKIQLEMICWHEAHYAQWGPPDLLERTLPWYEKAAPMAREIARRQGFDGLRWMKMTDPSATEAPSNVGSFLIWQQPHYIYLAELAYRNNPSEETRQKYAPLVQETAAFMADFATYDADNDRYVLKGCIPAQETLKASETVNPPFELSYWHFALETAQQWLERAGEPRNAHWDEILAKLSPLAARPDSLYLAAESATDTYEDIRFTSDHMAVLGALGILPASRLVDEACMRRTLHWVWDNWNWDKTWGWDYPMTAMNAARLGEPELAVSALLMDKRTNTYLPDGHNYQDDRLRIYLPGNGGLLTAVAMMCAGWDGCTEPNPGFPKDGNWNVRWEGLLPMP